MKSRRGRVAHKEGRHPPSSDFNQLQLGGDSIQSSLAGTAEHASSSRVISQEFVKAAARLRTSVDRPRAY